MLNLSQSTWQKLWAYTVKSSLHLLSYTIIWYHLEIRHIPDHPMYNYTTYMYIVKHTKSIRRTVTKMHSHVREKSIHGVFELTGSCSVHIVCTMQSCCVCSRSLVSSLSASRNIRNVAVCLSIECLDLTRERKGLGSQKLTGWKPITRVTCEPI